MSVLLQTIALLVVSNIFMTIAWYAHLGGDRPTWTALEYLGRLKDQPWLLAVLVSWCVAFVEYLFQVPANRIGKQQYDLTQLKILQEVISLTVFAGYLLFARRDRLNFDFLWAGLCILGAVYFVFRNVK
jgi:uncharacterized protein (DUF486 family)